MNLEREITKLNAIVEEALDVTDINVKEKTAQQVLGRMVVCNILMDNGLTPAVLAKYYVKHRTNFYHYRKKHNDYLQFPNMYPEYLELYAKVENDYLVRAKDAAMLSKLQRLEVVDEINKTIDDLRERKLEVLQTI